MIVCKDGSIRIWNTIENKLVKRIVSPIPKKLHEIYFEIPCIEFIDDSKLLYGIENKILVHET